MRPSVFATSSRVAVDPSMAGAVSAAPWIFMVTQAPSWENCTGVVAGSAGILAV